MVAHPLGAREHGVVVGHHDRVAAVDLADAADEAVGGGPRDQLLAGPPLLLGGEDQRAVLDERLWVDEVGEVLAGGPPAEVVALGDGVGAGGIECDCVAGMDGMELVGGAAPAARSVGASEWVPGASVASSWPSSTASPTATSTLRRIPSVSAVSSCSIFIASSTITAAPFARAWPGSSRDRDDGAGERRC